MQEFAPLSSLLACELEMPSEDVASEEVCLDAPHCSHSQCLGKETQLLVPKKEGQREPKDRGRNQKSIFTLHF